MVPEITPTALSWIDFIAIRALIVQGIAHRVREMGFPLGHLESGGDANFLDLTIMQPDSAERLVQLSTVVTVRGLDVTLRRYVHRVPGQPDIEDLATWKIRELEATPGTIEIISYLSGEKAYYTLAAVPPNVAIHGGDRGLEGVAADIAREALSAEAA